MSQSLTTALMTSIEALEQVPGTQLQHIEPTLRQLLTDLKNAGITLHADLYGLIEHAAIARAEIAAYKEIDPPYYPYEEEQYTELPITDEECELPF